MLAECPGWSLGVGLSGLGPLGELPGGALGARPRGTRGGLGSIRGILPAGVLGDRCLARRTPGYGLRVGHSGTGGVLGGIRRKSHGGSTRGQVSRSEASGEIITCGAHGALGSFREACGFGTWDTGRAPKVGPEGGFKNGTFRRRLSGWVSGQVSYSEGFRRGFRRRLRRCTRQG